MDQLEEKSSVLARSGSFYYKSLPEKPKNEANFMSHLPWQTKLFNLGNISQNLVLSGGHNRGNFRLIHFTDEDIDYYGMQQALQARIVDTVEITEDVETPLRTSSTDPWDYTSANTIMEATWSQVDLGSDIVVPEGILQRVDVAISGDTATAGYMHLLKKDSNGEYTELAVSDSVGTSQDGKMRWLFQDVKLSGEDLRVVITSSKDSVVGYVSITSSVNHLANDSITLHGTSIIEGVVPELVFFLRVVVAVEIATQRPDNFSVNYVTGVMNSDGDIIADNASAILFPTTDVTSRAIFTGSMRFGLRVNPDLWITSIQTPEKRLIAGYDFISEFGNLIFAVNPIQLFPDMSFMAYSFVERKRNLYSYSLRLDDVYGPVDRVLHYYRVSQSPRSFYLAAAQAAGFAIVRDDCTITEILPFRNGYIYITDNGTYEAPYSHTRLNVGDSIAEGTVIGGDQLFRMIFPGDSWPSGLGALNLDGILPVKGLKAPNSPIMLYGAGGHYMPAYTGSQSSLNEYCEYLDTYQKQQGAEPTGWEYYNSPDVTSVNVSIADGFDSLGYVHNDYSWEIKMRVDSYSPINSTSCITDIDSDYHFITQAGSYYGMSSSDSAMQGSTVSWPEPSATEDGINTWNSTEKIYGWISRTANGESGVAGVIKLKDSVISIKYDAYTDVFIFEVEATEQDNPVVERVIITGYNPNPSNIRFNQLSGTLLRLGIQKKMPPENAIQHVRNTVCKDKLLVACINYNVMSSDMRMRLETFMTRELPIGSVLTINDLPGTIS